MPFGLTEHALELLIKLFEGFPEIEIVKIYGSRAIGNYYKGSDIDLAFYAKTDRYLTATLLAELDELPLPYLFDVTNYYRIIHQPLKTHIDRVGIVIYEHHGQK